MSLSRRAAEERLTRGTGIQIIAAEAEATAAKTARLRAARMERDAAQALAEVAEIGSKSRLKPKQPIDD